MNVLPLFTDAEIARLVSPYRLTVEPPRRPEEIPGPSDEEIEEFRRLVNQRPEERRQWVRDQIDTCGPCDPFVVPDRDLSESYRLDGDPSAALFTPGDYAWLIAGFGLVVIVAAMVLYRLT